MKLSILIPILILISLRLHAMEFRALGGTISMNGEIVSGDLEKLTVQFASLEVPATIFHINSKGGDLDVAMKIGEFIEQSQIPLVTGKECYSACVFIFISAAVRTSGGSLGFHRPYFNKSYFSNLTSLEAKSKYDELTRISKRYLYDKGASNEVVERIFRTSSDKVDIATKEEVDLIFDKKAPYYEEWLSANCGSLSKVESEVIESLGYAMAFHANLEYFENPKNRTGDWLKTLTEQVKKGQLANTYSVEDLYRYKATGEKYNTCIDKAANKHIFSFHKGTRDYLIKLAVKHSTN